MSLCLLHLEPVFSSSSSLGFPSSFFKTFEVVVSSSSNNTNKEINEYHDSTSYSGFSSGNSSSGGNTMDEQYTSGIPGVPVEVFQE